MLLSPVQFAEWDEAMESMDKTKLFQIDRTSKSLKRSFCLISDEKMDIIYRSFDFVWLLQYLA